MPEIPRREFIAKAGVALAGLAVASAVRPAEAADDATSTPARKIVMKRYVIEREVPGIGASNAQQCSLIAAQSSAALAQLAPRIQWEHSYFTQDKTFCIYLAADEQAILEHSKLSGFPANKITLVDEIVDPTNAV